MRLGFAAGLACLLLMLDSMAVSSLGDVALMKPAIPRRAPAASITPLVLLVTGNGVPVAGVALTTQ